MLVWVTHNMSRAALPQVAVKILKWSTIRVRQGGIFLFVFFSSPPPIGLVSSTTHYIHYRDTFLFQNFHSISYSLSQELAPSRVITLLVIGTLLPRCKCLCCLCTSYPNLVYPNPGKATLHFSDWKTRPWRHNQETLLFLWGQCSASCAKINMAYRQAILMWVSKQLRRSSFGFHEILQKAFTHRATCPVSLATHADWKCLNICCELSLYHRKYLYIIKGTLTSVNRRLRFRHRLHVEAVQMLTCEALEGPEDKKIQRQLLQRFQLSC